MKSFRTELTLPLGPLRLTHRTPVMTIGSCFSDAIGNILARNKFNILANPFGVVYNPLSIHTLLHRAVANELPPDHTFGACDGHVYNFDFHSSFSGTTRREGVTKIGDALGICHSFIGTMRWLIITYGTAWVYERVDTGEVVANCHKVNSAKFKKRLLSADEITQSFAELLPALTSLAPEMKILLTVSPVRHLRDTVEGNSVSKAVLRVACHELCERHPIVDYFPAYEIMLDDLRDYRFYESDMLHPSEEAVGYTWEKFIHRYADADALDFIAKWDPLYRSLHHNPFHPAGESHRRFLADLLKNLEALRDRADVRAEIELVHQRLLSVQLHQA